MEFYVNKTNMVKCIAIILMLMHHLFGCATMFVEQYGTYSKIFAWDSIYQFSLAAKICVGIYVFLTAYGITKSFNAKFSNGETKYNKRAMEVFCFNRYIKLELNFAFVYILVFFTSFLRQGGLSGVQGGLSGVYAANGWKYGVMYMFFDLLGLSNYFSTPSLNETWWYMSVAILAVFLIPLFIKIYKSVGRVLIIIAAFLSYFGVSETNFLKYLFCIVIGIWCAEETVFERCNKVQFCRFKYLSHLIKIAICILVFAVLVILRMKTSLNYYIDAIVPITICVFCMELGEISRISEKVMGFIGKHSMNMFLIHTIIFEYYFTGFIYGFKNWILVLLALLVTSLLASIVIEWLKKVLHYPEVIRHIMLKE